MKSRLGDSTSKIKFEIEILEEKKKLDREQFFFRDYPRLYQILELKKKKLESDPESYFREKNKEVWDIRIKILLMFFYATSAIFLAYVISKDWNSILIKNLIPKFEKIITDMLGMKFSLHILPMNFIIPFVEFLFLFYSIGKFYSLIYDLWKKEDEFSDEEVFF